ncbi:TPA: hypothetical protein DEG21_02460 [Patescibacteria group bacterium]|nr:hypothetical protein [Candidatus Gracilibacteria bacterium]HBY74740.1 hypothetical protein [Candidatus Gracilibacteria bacterium]
MSIILSKVQIISVFPEIISFSEFERFNFVAERFFSCISFLRFKIFNSLFEASVSIQKGSFFQSFIFFTSNALKIFSQFQRKSD